MTVLRRFLRVARALCLTASFLALVAACHSHFGAISSQSASAGGTCPNGKTVELITIAGAGHGWPGGDENPVTEKLFRAGPPSTALNATQVIWQFFAAHPK